MQALHSNLCKDKYLPSFSVVLTNEKFAASCRCSPRSVKGRMCEEWERGGICPLAIGHRSVPLAGLGKHTRTVAMNGNKTLSSKLHQARLLEKNGLPKKRDHGLLAAPTAAFF